MAGVCSMMSWIGNRSSWCSAMNNRGMSGKVERHVTLVAVAEIRDRVLGPLVRLGQEHPVGIPRFDVRAQRLEELMRLRQVLAVRVLALEEVGHGVEPHAVDAHLEPEVERAGRSLP